MIIAVIDIIIVMIIIITIIIQRINWTELNITYWFFIVLSIFINFDSTFKPHRFLISFYCIVMMMMMMMIIIIKVMNKWINEIMNKRAPSGT